MVSIEDFSDIVINKFKEKYPNTDEMPKAGKNSQKDYLLYCMNTTLYELTGIKYSFHVRVTENIEHESIITSESYIVELYYKSVLIRAFELPFKSPQFTWGVRNIGSIISYYKGYADDISYIDKYYPSLFRKVYNKNLGYIFDSLIPHCLTTQNIESLYYLTSLDTEFVKFLVYSVLGYDLREVRKLKEVVFNSKTYIVFDNKIAEKGVCEIIDDTELINNIKAKTGLLEVE